MAGMCQADQSPLGRWIRTACIAEASVPKPGNVHPGAPFADLCYDDFVASAVAAAPHLAQSGVFGVGRAVLEAVAATQRAVGKNTNLGICLLIAPLSAVPLDVAWEAGVADVLSRTTVDDSRAVYQAIRLANPGGMGQVAEQDLHQAPTLPLQEVMRLGAAGRRETLFHPRDSIARQYAENYWQLVLALESFRRWARRASLDQAIAGLHLSLMAAIPDTLIARKCGIRMAIETARGAADLLAAGWPECAASRRGYLEFDAWVRADGNRRNPGTTADFVAAVLFLAQRTGFLSAEDLESIAATSISGEPA